MRYAIILLAGISCACRAQSNLTTPASLLPKADHSAAGIFNFYDQNKANEMQIQYNALTSPTLAVGIVLKDASGTTTGNSLSLQTNAGADFFHIIGGTDAAAPGRVVANGGLEVTPLNATFSGIQVSQSQNASGIESDITGAGLAAFFGTSTNTSPTLRMTNSNATGIAGYFQAPIALNLAGEVQPNADATYITGDPTHRWLGIYGVNATLSNLSGSGTVPVCANNSGVLIVGGCGGGGGTVTSIATSSPITGGTITTTGTIGCATCLTTAGGQTISSFDTFLGGLHWDGAGSAILDASGGAEFASNVQINGAVFPQSNNTFNNGTPALYWLATYTQTAFIGKSNSDASTIYTGSSGNFYDRPVSSSSGISCTSVNDGWMAVALDGYLVVCLNSGTRYRAALTSY